MLPTGFDHYNELLNDIRFRFTIKTLKALCQAAALPVSGTKPTLQERLRQHLEILLDRQQSVRYQMVRTTAEIEKGQPYGGGGSRIRLPNVTTSPGHPVASSSQANNAWGLSSLYLGLQLPNFKRLPFYNILTNVTQTYNILGSIYRPVNTLTEACPSSRSSTPIQARLTTQMIAKLDPKSVTNPYRLVLFCTQSGRVPYGNCLIEFPSAVEIRCNGSQISANLRGIKNRPGTVNPPDLTPHAILMHGVNNRVDITFQDSRSNYTALLYLVEKFTVAQLVEKVKKRGYISKEQTLSRMKAAAQDADLVPGPETLTLKDPVSMTRITIPCKSRYCQHTSCFDLSTFFALNEQTPTWNCPICARSITTDDDLYMDGYFMDILEKTNGAVESVVIHPDGTWTNKDIDTDHPDAKLLNNSNSNNVEPTPSQEERKLFASIKPEVVSLDDDDEEPSVPTPASLPPRSSLERSTSMRPSPSVGGGSGSSSRKRGPPQIVDLTLSDDDDEVLPAIRRPVSQKRPSQQPPAKRIRVAFLGENPSQVSTTPQTNGNGRRFSAIIDRGSLSHSPTTLTPPGPQPTQQTQQTQQPSHIRSPPLSISPRNENPPNIFRPNHSPTLLDNPLSSTRPISTSTTSPASATTNLFNRGPSFQAPPPNNVPQRPLLPATRIEPQPTRQFEPPSGTLARSSYPTPTTLTSNDRAQRLNNPRSRSASPVLPAFSNKPLNNSLRSVNWDNLWLNGADDDFENPELDLEMARLPSSMFDADGRQDDSDY